MIKGMWNMIATPLFFVAPYLSDQLAQITGASNPTAVFYSQLFLEHGFIFGMCFFMAGRDLTDTRYHIALKVGIATEYLLAVIVFSHGIAGNIDLMLMGPGVVDLIAAILMTKFFMDARTKGLAPSTR